MSLSINEVKRVQTLLNKDGFNLTVDGLFGNATRTAVKAFQRRYGLIVDGFVGRNTNIKLDAIERRKFTRYEYDHQTSYFVFKKSDIEKIDICNSIGKTETVKLMYNRKRPASASNGGLFDMSTGSTCHYFFDEGKRQGYNAYAPFAFCIFNDGTMGFRNVEKDPPNLKDAIGFSPSLVIDGKKNMNTKNLSSSFLWGNAPRHAFMETKDHYIEVFVKGRTVFHKGASLYQLADICLNIGKRYDGCLNGGALDGGNSINMVLEGSDVISNYSRPVDNSIMIYTRG
ncbi:MAG TPA: peptidoglycan-binding protein [Fusibacter sp.]|nr:peptidoglycan-binding protein [Fusibacter sp.]